MLNGRAHGTPTSVVGVGDVAIRQGVRIVGFAQVLGTAGSAGAVRSAGRGRSARGVNQ